MKFFEAFKRSPDNFDRRWENADAKQSRDTHGEPVDPSLNPEEALIASQEPQTGDHDEVDLESEAHAGPHDTPLGEEPVEPATYDTAGSEKSEPAAYVG